MKNDRMHQHFETGVLHDVQEKQPHGALNSPIYQSSTFVFENTGHGGACFAGTGEGFIYTRLGNPTTNLLERKIAAMEGGEDCVAFSSGMGAIAATLLTLLSQGDHLLADAVLYGCTHALMAHTLPRFGISTQFVDFADLSALKASLRPDTKLVYFETPANPTLKIIDIQAVVRLVRSVSPSCLVLVDNTFATPYLSRPLGLGADIVLHSATKYLCGHGDVIAGMAVGSKELIFRVRNEGRKDITGSVLSPNDAYLLLRGIKTLKIRMDAHCMHAGQVARFLSTHPAVAQVHYPGLPGHKGHGVAARQMQQFGGIIAFDIKGDVHTAARAVDSLKLCTLAVSLGDAETLVEHPGTMTHSTYCPIDQRQLGIGEGLVRLSIGLEHPEDIIADLKQALDSIL